MDNQQENNGCSPWLFWALLAIILWQLANEYHWWGF